MNDRPFEDNDLSKIARWNTELHEDEGSTPMSVADAESRLRAWLLEDKFDGAIFEVDGEEVGYILYERREASPEERDSKPAIYVRQFYIARDHRRQGIGSLAFRRFKAKHGMGEVRLVLDVKATNPLGQRFWEQLGFVPQHIEYHLN